MKYEDYCCPNCGHETEEYEPDENNILQYEKHPIEGYPKIEHILERCSY